jgi:hypothetical protein
MRILGDFANSQILDAALEYDFFILVHSAKHRSPEAQSMQSKISKFDFFQLSVLSASAVSSLLGQCSSRLEQLRERELSFAQPSRAVLGNDHGVTAAD